MVEDNHTFASEFILLGFTSQKDLQVTCFVFFLAIYVVTLVGNLRVILLIKRDLCLHTPRSFFLSPLSLLDVCCSSTIIPQTSRISLLGCFAQIYFFVALVICECFLLGVMAFDRYVAVCRPLLYAAVMSRARCHGSMALVYATGFLSSLVHVVLVGRLSFCQGRDVNHFFCELPTILQLSCSDARASEILQVSDAVLTDVGSILMILVSYAYIIGTIVRMPAGRGRLKGFSTCTSHLVAITIFYAPVMLTYFQPRKARSRDQAKAVSVCYALLTPALNPLIYSLRNAEVKGALRRLWVRKLAPR
ncbi:OR5F1 protein, partial [Piaya cayana]|nr:OR5F1 protein [Piaya cayana]